MADRDGKRPPTSPITRVNTRARASRSPSVRFQTFGESGVGFAVSLQGQQFVDQFLLRHEFVKRLQARFSSEGIVMPIPSRVIAAREPIQVEIKTV